MDNKIVFVRTSKGDETAKGRAGVLAGDIRRALLMVDGTATVGELCKRAAPSLRNNLESLLLELAKTGFIQDSAQVVSAPKIITPPKIKQPTEANSGEELDFTAAFRPPTAEELAAEAAKLKVKEEAKAAAEAARQKAEQEARAAAERKAQEEAERKAKEEAERKAKEEAERKAKEEAERKAKEEAERKAREEAEAAQRRAEEEAKAAAEAARLKAEQEARAAAERKAQEEAERKAKEEAERKAREEAEAAQRRAEEEAKAAAEAARQKAEQEARAAAERKAQEEAERKAKEEAERKAKEEAERKAREEAEAAQRRAEEEAKAAAEAARLKAEQEARAAAERKAQEEAERKAKEEAERKAKEEAERKAREEAEAAQRRAEEEAKAAAEAARLKAEQEARAAAERKAKEEAERKAKEEAERKAREEAEAAQRRAEEEAKAAAEAARQKAEQEARAAAERKAQEEAERKAKEEAERKAKEEAERKAKEEAERKAREEAEAAQRRAEEEAKAAAEAARQKAEQEARAVAERKAREAAEIERRIQAESESKSKSKSKSKSESENTGAHKAAEAAAEEFRQQAEQHLADAHEAEKASYVAEVDGDETSQARQQAEAALLQSAMELAEAKVESDDGGNTATKLRSRSTSATVLFFDVVGYTKQSISKQIEMKKQFNLLLSECLGLLGDVDPIILDTGDGAAVGFLQHPEDAIEVAVEFRKRVLENRRKHHRDLQVRTGIHLGPVNIVKDMNGQSNLLGDGINDAQRVMSFAGIDQIYISRSYYDFISRLSDEFAEMFIYRGEQKDKHNRSHAVYEYSEAGGDSPIGNLVLNKPVENTAKIKLEPFNISMPEAVGVVVNQPAEAPPAEVQPKPQPKPPQKPPKPIPNRSELEETSKSPKFVEKGYIPSADEVSSMAAAQAKAWADAEKRAQELAQGRLESSAQQATTATEAKPSKPRKPLPWGKIAIEAVLLLLIALFVGPHFLPTKDYAVKVEQLLESQLQQPVHIEKLAVRLLPSPSMELSAVAVGESVAVKIEQVKIDFALSSLWSSTKKINKLLLQGAEVNGAALQPLSQWLQQIAPNPQYPITRIEFAKSKFEFGAIQFADIAGNLEFDSSGSFSHATLQGSNDKFTVEMKAAENKTLLSLRVRDSVIPLLPNWQFSELNASGELTADELIVSDIDSRIAGGMLQGNGRLNWRSGWRAEGSLAAKTITLENISSILMGDMDGSARFTMQSDKLDALTDSVRMDGSFIVSKGTINGMDFVETTRLRSSNNIPGGRTHFDEAGGDLSLSGKVLSLRGMKMKAGVLSATGYVDIADDHLSGRVISELSIRAEMGSVPLQLGGTLGIPELKAVR